MISWIYSMIKSFGQLSCSVSSSMVRFSKSESAGFNVIEAIHFTCYVL